MSAGGKETEEWRLGIEPGAHETPEVPEEQGTPRNYSAERLGRPLCVVTAEHLGWAKIGVLALLSRLVMLGARPLDSAEARHALSELALLQGGAPAAAHLSWVHLLEAAIFVALGAGDFCARLMFALSGLLLIGAAFAMRRHLGRAGAMAFAALLTLSPSVAYYSRADSVVPTLAFAVLALAVFLQLTAEPGRLLAAALGAAIGLGLASSGAAAMTALFMLGALAVVGLFAALGGSRSGLQVRVWWTRRKGLFLIAIFVAAIIWMGCESGFFTRSPLAGIVTAFRSNLSSAGPPGEQSFAAGLDFYLPILLLYEFLVVLLGVAGALAVLTLRIRSRIATGALVWSALAVAFYLWMPVRSPALMLQMIVPMALLGAVLIDSLHHTAAWSLVRYPLAVLAILTLCLQAANNFMWYAPDASQAPWARTALLFWTDPATTLQTPVQCARVTSQAPPRGASVFFAADSPVLRWYLRAFTPTAKPQGASAIVSSADSASLPEAEGLTAYEFELDDAWHPAWRSLSPQKVLHYMVSARAWAPLDSHRMTIAIRPVVTVAPTVILAPVEPAPAPTASAPPAQTPTPAAAASPTAEISAIPSASAMPAPGAGPESSASTTPSGSPSDTPAATPAASSPATQKTTSAATVPATPMASPAATVVPSPSAIPSSVPGREPAAAETAAPAGRNGP
ncbi:MAG TPA: hypothetical protein VGI29_03130 [Candidatus Binataceae bacterium]